MTIEELKENKESSLARIANLENYLKIDEKQRIRKEIEESMSEPGFWDNQEKAQDSVTRLSLCKKNTGII